MHHLNTNTSMIDSRILHRRGVIWILWVSLGLTLLSWLAVYWNLDLLISGRFYVNGKWYLEKSRLARILYHYGTLPGIALTAGALLVWLGGYFNFRLAPWRRYCLLVVLTSVLGAGILVNSVLKEYWGRPRPEQIQAFGGVQKYRPFYSPGRAGEGASFPSGHATMGFIFVTLLFLHKKSCRIAYAGGALGIGWGVMLGAARIVQGGHFFTDVLWSLGVILLTAGVLHYFVLRIPLGVNQATAVPPQAVPRSNTSVRTG